MTNSELIYTGIGWGHRTIKDEHRRLAYELARTLAQRGWKLRTRNAVGLDPFFWRGHFSVANDPKTAEVFTGWGVTPKALKKADYERKKNADGSSDGMRWGSPRYHRSSGRSIQSILGEDLRRPSNLIIYTARGLHRKTGVKENNRVAGDTLQLILLDLSRRHRIPAIDLKQKEGRDLAQRIIDGAVAPCRLFR